MPRIFGGVSISFFCAAFIQSHQLKHTSGESNRGHISIFYEFLCAKALAVQMEQRILNF